jgi:hypothetical protein
VSFEGLRSAGVTPTTLIWRDGLPQWTAASELPELAGLFRTQASPIELAAAPSRYSAQPTAAAGQAYSPQAYAAQSYPTQGGYVQYQAPQAALATNGLAVASLVMGILAPLLMCVYFIGIVPAVLAIIFGHMARGQISRGQGSGDGLAIAGLVLGYIAAGLIAAVFVVAIIFVAAAAAR